MKKIIALVLSLQAVNLFACEPSSSPTPAPASYTKKLTIQNRTGGELGVSILPQNTGQTLTICPEEETNRELRFSEQGKKLNISLDGEFSTEFDDITDGVYEIFARPHPNIANQKQIIISGPTRSQQLAELEKVKAGERTTQTEAFKQSFCKFVQNDTASHQSYIDQWQRKNPTETQWFTMFEQWCPGVLTGIKSKLEVETKARLDAEAKKKADEETARKKAAEEKAKIDAEAKKKADEEAARKKAAEEKARLDTEAKKKAEEKARLDAEAKKKADEETARKKAAEEKARLDAEAKKKAADEKAKIDAEAKKKAAEAQNKIADDTALQALSAAGTAAAVGQFAFNLISQRFLVRDKAQRALLINSLEQIVKNKIAQRVLGIPTGPATTPPGLVRNYNAYKQWAQTNVDTLYNQQSKANPKQPPLVIAGLTAQVVLSSVIVQHQALWMKHLLLDTLINKLHTVSSSVA